MEPCTVRICFSGTWNRTFLNFVRLGSSFQGVGTVHFQVCVRLDYLFLEMEPYHGLMVCCLYGCFPANELQNRTGLPRWPEQADSAENTRLFKTDTLVRDHAGSFRPAGAAAHQKYQNLFDALDTIYRITKQIISLFFFSCFIKISLSAGGRKILPGRSG